MRPSPTPRSLSTESSDPPAVRPDARARAESPAYAVRNVFEPPEPPGPEAAAAAVVAVFEDLISPYRTWIHAYERTYEPG